jgi:2-octaprenyl-6-methoxyphenol hydroxylase
MLDRYQQARFADMRLRVQGIDLLNRASQARAPLLRDARAAGLNALYDIAPLRKTLMQMGLGLGVRK